ncbi:hypothetical protein PRIPAC_93305 [Pristionchus pacificus]|uniref:PBPb domain-containing protein n=1 Tax=Pristionchus pacificus TaxID=54126 RepID=A0A2A6BAG2_PRIPA|nr:hypothetical protein PRIPAC_93305 [Pristionchus pacificus]|eukprot:PDM62875.1 hypothetical protein PRIPAC_50090 [Pristionchus pacificus]
MEEIVVGFDAPMHPFLFYSPKGKMVGYIADLYRLTSHTLGMSVRFKQYEFVNHTTEVEVFPLFEALNNSEIFSIGDGYGLTQERFKDYLFSVPILFQRSSIFESIHTKEESEFIDYSVFRVDTLAVIIACQIVIDLIAFFHFRFKKEGDWKLFEFVILVLYSAARCLSLWGFAFVFFYYSAGFQGNNVVLVPASPTTFPELVADLHSKKRWMTGRPDFMFPNEREIVLGCIPMHVERDLAVSIATICSDHTAVARLIIPSSELVKQYPPLFTYRDELPLYAFFSRTQIGTRRFLSRFNYIQLQMFSEDAVINFWNLRNVPSLRNLGKEQPAPKLAYVALSMEKLSVVFFCVLPLYGLCLASLIIELVMKVKFKI